MSQMEIPFLINSSPDLGGPHDYEDHWATYELNGESIDHEPGIFGKVRVHDDYWNIDHDEREYYNFEIRNNMYITTDQLDKMRQLAHIKQGISLLSHCAVDNVKVVMDWAEDKDDVCVITTAIGTWERDIELWAMREFNFLMEDDRNANYSKADHSLTDIHDVLVAYRHRIDVDMQWRNEPSDVLLYQTDWQTLQGLKGMYSKLGISAPSNIWLENYLNNFYSKQEFNEELLMELAQEWRLG